MIGPDRAITPAPPRQKLLVIGNGMAGARIVEEILRRRRDLFDITVIGEEPRGNYNRVLLSNVLSGTQDPGGIYLNPVEWYQKNNVALLAGKRAVMINTATRAVTLSDERLVFYDRLIIATGSRPFIPPIRGTHLQGVFAFRTVDDCEAITGWARGAKSAAVIGGGLLGLEAARGLMTHGVNVHVIDVNPHLMSVQLDAAGGAVLARAVAALGITAHLTRRAVEIIGDDQNRVRALKFDNGEELGCDMVVISAGIRPNSELARHSAIKTERGILVDDLLRTSERDVYAVGECAQHDGKVYGLVAPIFEQCAVLADHLTGADPDHVYRGSFLTTKLKVMGVNVASMGERDERDGDEVVRYEDPCQGVYKKLIVRERRLIGAMLIGEIDRYGELLMKMQSGEPLPSDRSDLLFGSTDDRDGSLAELPDAHQVCDCNGVAKGTIVAAINDGACTVAAIGKCTRAGTGCGSCRKLIQALIETVAGDVKADPSENWYVPAVPMDKSTLVAEIRKRRLRSVSAVLNELGTSEDAKSKMGLASLLKSLWNSNYIDERDSRFVNDRVHANIQKDGTFSVIPRIYGGVTTADELIRIGEVAKKYHVRAVKITGGQRIDLLGVAKEDLPRVWTDLGMPSGHAYTKAFRTCKTCVGSEWCRFGTNDSTALGIEIEKRFQGIEFPAKVKLAVSGCPRNCAEATVKDIGIVASEGGDWEIVLGGAAGASVRKADVLCRVKTRAEAMTIIGRFMQYYRLHARYLERTYDFVPRIGIQHLREILVEDRDGIGAQLDAEIQSAIDAYVDPWTEADAPAYPAQFIDKRSVALPVLA